MPTIVSMYENICIVWYVTYILRLLDDCGIYYKQQKHFPHYTQKKNTKLCKK